MCERCPSPTVQTVPPSTPDTGSPWQARRTFLRRAGAGPLMMGGLGGLSGAFALAHPAMAQAPKPGNVLAPEAALQRLMEGNARYVSNKPQATDFASTRQALTTGQNPYACVLSCADSRVSPNFCFDEERGDLFVNRLAGNYVNADMIANIEYGVAVLGASLIMVLGHTDCGAIKAAVKARKEGTDFPGHIQLITTALSAAVKAAEGRPGDLVEAVTRANVKLSVEALKSAPPLIQKRVTDKKLLIVGGLYHLDTGRVELIA